MTSGIYLLRFDNTDKVYIGQSKNIEDRYISHKTAMRIGKASKKLQSAYTSFGLPFLEVLEECSQGPKMGALEDQYIIEFDSVANGFNTMSNHGYSSSASGELCGNSKYLNSKIYEVFNYLIEGRLHKVISEITGVSRGTISDISALKSHTWLRDEYPDEYIKLVELASSRRQSRRTAKSRNIEYPALKAPDGSLHIVDSIRGFAKQYNLNPNCLGRVLRKQAKSHNGWILHTV